MLERTTLRYVAFAAFANAASSIVGFLGYTLARTRGEPFESLGYLAFIAWSIALLPIMIVYYQFGRISSKRASQITSIIGIGGISAGVLLEASLLSKAVRLDNTAVWNFGSACALGIWFTLAHSLARAALSSGLRWLGTGIGTLWVLAFLLLGAAGFPQGGPQGKSYAAIGFGADAMAYFGSIVWAIWLGRFFQRDRRPRLFEKSVGMLDV